jgi:1-deoxy-D-xylulose-5-phosphate reductoisomerase
METFRGLAYAFEAAKKGGSMPTIFNAANERAVGKFLSRKIGFTDIYEIIRYCMDTYPMVENPDVQQILDAEQGVYELIESRW